jgi:hypothetical protein
MDECVELCQMWVADIGAAVSGGELIEGTFRIARIEIDDLRAKGDEFRCILAMKDGGMLVWSSLYGSGGGLWSIADHYR